MKKSEKNGARIIEVTSGGPADQAGVSAGDELISINGATVRDVIDFQFFCLEDDLELALNRNGRLVKVSIHQSEPVPLGLKFGSSVFDRLKTCVNNCQFCFIDQLPSGLRPSLYIKDDDFRLSFLYGNFITLTNLAGRHIERIVEQRLSPMYVSLHSADPEVRRHLVEPRGSDRAWQYLTELIDGGIEVHIQIVLCPGINDGDDLDNTIAALERLGVASIGIVPVGLTGFREGLAKLRPVSSKLAARLIDQIIPYQQRYLKERGSRMVFAADEIYLLAGIDFPEDEAYEGYPQLENGIGLARLFLTEINEALEELPKPRVRQDAFIIMTAGLAAPVLERAAKAITTGWGINFELVIAENHFAGGGVSVAGLLGGGDIIRAAKKIGRQDSGLPVLVPEVCLNRDRLFLDDLSAETVLGAQPLKLEFVPSTGRRFLEYLAKISAEKPLSVFKDKNAATSLALSGAKRARHTATDRQNEDTRQETSSSKLEPKDRWPKKNRVSLVFRGRKGRTSFQSLDGAKDDNTASCLFARDPGVADG